MKHGKYWDYNGKTHLPTGAGFLPSTAVVHQALTFIADFDLRDDELTT